MDDRQYWLDLFTAKTWEEFLAQGGGVTGFRERRWSVVQRMRQGDRLLCYLTGISRWIGLLEVTGRAFQDTEMIWSDETFPSRIHVQVLVALTPETAIPVHDLADELSVFQNLSSPNAWTGHFRGSPARWSTLDGSVVERTLFSAQRNPVVRPFDKRRLDRRPKALTTEIGPVVVPDEGPDDAAPAGVEPREATLHTEIQWLLLKLGSDLGLHVWAARNDRRKSFDGNSFAALPRYRESLPRQFDEATNRTIELIDVLWLNGSTIVAAFEVESTTSVYSGLLRMSDLITMQPNLNIPLYLVAPEDRRRKVIAEVNRPTFSRLVPPMRDVCRFIGFSTLQEKMEEFGAWARYLKPDILMELSESCDLEDS